MTTTALNNKKVINTRNERKFVTCPSCHQTTVIDFVVEICTITFFSVNKGCEIEEPCSQYYRIDGDSRVEVKSNYVATCPRCHAAKPVNKTLKAKVSKKHICGNDCRSAVSDNCTCSCNGANHGINHKISEYLPA